MPDIYFERPCPVCGGRVRRTEGAPFCECVSCGKRFALKTPPKEPVSPPPTKKDKKASGFFSLLRRFFSAIGKECVILYGRFYRWVRKKNDRFPLPKPPSDDPKPLHTPEPPMDEGQRALYRARKKQLESRGGASVSQAPLTKGERLEDFISAHRIFSLTVSIVAVVLTLSLLTVGITFCVKEKQINKNDFRFYCGVEETGLVTERRAYDFVAFKTKNKDRKISHRINMTKIATLCNLTISGTQSTPKYAVRGGSSYVKFTSGSPIALINGTNYEMGCAAIYDESGDLWIDLYFARDILSGITVTVDLENNRIYVTRNTTPEGTVLNPVYESVSISAGNHSAYEGGGATSVQTATYKTDVSAYAADLHPSDSSYLILANKQNPLAQDHIPSDLVSLTVPTTKTIELRSSAARALEAMFFEMKADGITDLSVTSGYRSYNYQKWLFDYYVSEYQQKGYSYEEAVKLVESDTARPGYSEHQTGLCVDFWTSTMTSLSNEFENTEASQWLRENAWRFGFILRYPSDKIDTTGYTYESWHYRFVGVDAASEIRKNGWCFEEYVEKSASKGS